MLALDGERERFSARALGGARFEVQWGERRLILTVYGVGDRVAVFGEDASALVTEIDPLAHAGEHKLEGGRLTAPMPGKVVAFLARVGERVAQGQALAVMEAMKMEHTLSAPRDGVVEELLYAVGDPVAEGGELLRLEAL